MLLREILSRIPGAAPPPRRVVRVRGIAYDSRQVAPGDLFVAMRGATTDGNRFVADAVERGAVAIASEQALELPPPVAAIRTADARLFLAQASTIFFQNPSARLRLVGVTGTNGKTTTTYLVESIYRAAGLESCLVGTIGMRIGRQPLPAERTTPEAPDLQLFLRRALGEGCTHGVMEVSSHALELKRVFGTRFVVGVFSNLTPDHLDFHRDMESYYQAKRLLFVPAGENHVERAAINIDDAYGERLARETACAVLSYGSGDSAQVRLLDSTTRVPSSRGGRAGAVSGTDLRVGTPSGELRLASRLVGRTNAYNALAAASAAIALGIDREAIRAGIEMLEGIPGRTELVDCGQSFAVVVDYAHTPDALEKILATLAELPHRRILTVFGCGGDRDRTKRPIMGRIAAERSDIVIATSDNPRSERPESILDEIREGLRQGKAEWSISVDRREAIERAILAARAGDIVLIAGKGHEGYQVIGERKLPFDDRKVARDVLSQLAAIEGRGGA